MYQEERQSNLFEKSLSLIVDGQGKQDGMILDELFTNRDTQFSPRELEKLVEDSQIYEDKAIPSERVQRPSDVKLLGMNEESSVYSPHRFIEQSNKKFIDFGYQNQSELSQSQALIQ